MPVGYRIDANAANTKDLGQGLGLAQVIDPNSNIPFLKLQQEREQNQQNQEDKKKAAQDSQLQKELAGLGEGIWQGVDDERIGGHIKTLTDYTEQNIDKLRNGDIATKIQFDNLKRGIDNEAAMSNKQMKEYYTSQKSITNNPDAYYDNEVKNFMDYGGKQRSQLENIPTFDKRVDSFSHFDKVGTIMKNEADKSNRTTVVTPQEAEQRIVNEYNQNPSLLKADRYALDETTEPQLNAIKTQDGKILTKDQDIYNSNPSKYDLVDNKNVTDFGVAVHTPQIMGKWVTPAPQPNAYTATKEADKTNVTSTVTDNGHDISIGKNNNSNEKVITPVKSANGQVVDVNQINFHKDPKNGEISATGVVPLTSEQKQENVKVEATNLKNLNQYHIDLKKAHDEANTLETGEAPVYPTPPIIIPKPFSEKIVPLNKEDANAKLHTVYGGVTNSEDLFKGKVDKGKVNYQHNDNSTNREGKSTDKSNQKQSFTKQELEDKAVNAGYSYKDYYDLVKDKIILK